MQVIDFKCYRQFIQACISEANPRRGHLAILARAASCQAAYLSQVLKSKAHLTPEQAASLTKYWEMPVIHAEYFINLVLYARAGTLELQKIVQLRLDAILKETVSLKERFHEENIMSEQNRALYYSHWHWSLIHMALHIPQLRTILAISKAFDIPQTQVSHIVSGLVSFGLVSQQVNGTYLNKEHSLHIGSDSPFRVINASHYYNKALADHVVGQNDSVHYVALYALSKEDAEQLRRMTLEFIASTRRLVAPSPAEALQAFLVSTFKLGINKV